jgi:NAD(P)-dependent dehydrogenase (short-subunit alcohol dehydrogenase family)
LVITNYRNCGILEREYVVESFQPKTIEAQLKLNRIMASKIVVITGSTAGLGYHCAQFLAKSSSVTCIILACRNTVAASKAADEIRAANTSNSEPKSIVVLPEPCDLSDLKSVRAYSIALKLWLAGREISALVNNAGIGGRLKYSKNAAGHEMTFATNHLGHFLLTILLLPSITECIINVSSEVHDPATKTYAPDPEIGYPKNTEEYNIKLLGGEPLEGENDAVSGQRRYSRSKFCNVLFTNELAFRLSGDIPSHPRCAVLCRTVLKRTILYYTVMYSLCCTLLCCTVL